MRNFFILFLVQSLLMLSCSSDDDGTDTSASIVGKWIATDVEFSGSTTATGQGQSINATFSSEPVDLNHTLTFTESPNEVVSEGGFSLEITSSLNGQTEIETLEGESLVETGGWEQNGNQLTIINSEDGGDIQIFELTASRLVIGTDISEMETADGVAITLNSTFKIIYRRE